MKGKSALSRQVLNSKFVSSLEDRDASDCQLIFEQYRVSLFFTLQLYCLWNQGYFPRIISMVEDNIIIIFSGTKN